MATQKTAPNTWEDVFRLGSVVDISVQYWTGTEGLDPSAMGVELPEALQRSLRLTSKRLLPAAAFQEFKRIENSVYRLCSGSARRFPINRWFFPEGVLLPTIVKLTAIRDVEFPAAVARFFARYDRMRLDAPALFSDFIEQSWALFEKAGASTSKEEYRASFLAKIEQAFPSKEDLRERFAFDFIVSGITEPSADLGLPRVLARHSERVNLFLLSAANEARNNVRDAASRVQGMIDHGGSIRGQTLSSLKGSLETFLLMDFIGDTAVRAPVERSLTTLRAYDAEDIRHEPAAASALRNVLASVVAAAPVVWRVQDLPLFLAERR